MSGIERDCAASAIAATLLEQKEQRVERGFYWENQIAFAYNSEKMEGNPLTRDQTRAMFETRTLNPAGLPSTVAIDHITETANHFRLFDLMLETYDKPLTRELMWEYHGTLKRNTSSDAPGSGIVVGGWKSIPNRVADVQTTPPELVDAKVSQLIASYESKADRGYRDVAGFHVFFENIHPFQDGNGRIGRMVMFKECLRSGLDPFIVLDEHKPRYYMGLSEFMSDESIMLGFIEDMADRYMREYVSLIPEWHLLPKMRVISGRDDPAGMLDASYDDFFGSGS